MLQHANHTPKRTKSESGKIVTRISVRGPTSWYRISGSKKHAIGQTLYVLARCRCPPRIRSDSPVIGVGSDGRIVRVLTPSNNY